VSSIRHGSEHTNELNFPRSYGHLVFGGTGYNEENVIKPCQFYDVR